MKKGWEEKFLVKEFSLKSGDNLPAKKQVEGPYPVYGGNGIAGYHNEYNITGDNILIGRVGALCGNIHHTNGKVWVTDNAFVVNKIATYWDINFLTLELKYLKLNQYASQTAQPVISNKSMKDVRLFLPPLSEQKEIVEYLDSSFAKIDKLKENAAKNLEEAKALFQSALKDALEPKEGWEEKMLKDVTTAIGDGLHGTPHYTVNGGYYFINGNNLEDGKIVIKEDTKQVDVTEYNKLKINLEGNTLLLSINGTIGKNAFYNGEEIVLGKSACYLSVTSELKKEYLRYFILSDYFFKYVQKNSRQATIKNLGLKEIRMMPIPIPPMSEQQSIVSFLDSLNEKVNTLQQNYSRICDECDALKQAILRQVFE